MQEVMNDNDLKSVGKINYLKTIYKSGTSFGIVQKL